MPHLNETYHSSHGAITESTHVYIRHGLEHVQLPQLRILEIGFGTGLNALLTYNYGIKHSLQITYDTLEPYPLSSEVYRKLNYCEQLGNESIFVAMHQSAHEEMLDLRGQFKFTKHVVTVLDFDVKDKYDLIYYDAFAPSKQPDMWQLPIFEKMYVILNDGGILVTYCASGQFKRTLVSAGFQLETLPGPPGKFQMSRGRKGD